MNNTHSIGHIVNTARQIEELRTKIGHMKEDFERAVERATPLDGWPGKNAEARDAAKAAWIHKDDECQALRTDIRNAEIRLATLSADMTAFELERRDREWGIRMGIIEALRIKGVSEALPF